MPLFYCRSSGIVGEGGGGGGGGLQRRRRAKTLTFSNISIITEDIYLKLRVVVHYQKGISYQKGR